MTVIAALLALAMQAPPTEPTVPELWARVVAMRAERDRQHVRVGIETPSREAIRHDLEDEVARRIRPARRCRRCKA